MLKLAQAIQSLQPDAQFKVRGSTTNDIIWLSDIHPTDSEIQAEIQRLQTEYDNNQYARDRATQYAPLADQLDMLWHAIDQGIDLKQSDFYTGNKAVKDAHPKGGN